jgi:hypothetical protein
MVNTCPPRFVGLTTRVSLLTRLGWAVFPQLPNRLTRTRLLFVPDFFVHSTRNLQTLCMTNGDILRETSDSPRQRPSMRELVFGLSLMAPPSPEE